MENFPANAEICNGAVSVYAANNGVDNSVRNSRVASTSASFPLKTIYAVVIYDNNNSDSSNNNCDCGSR